LADIDGDGDLDLFIGNYFGETVFFRNTAAPGSSNPAYAPASKNPFGIGSVGFGDNASPAFADIDADGDLDLFLGHRGGDIFGFRNTGSIFTPAYAPASKNPFGISPVGSFSKPSFADIDGDGDLDLLIGIGGGETFLFRNTAEPGSSNPAYAPASKNPFGISNVGVGSSPALADIDADGDLDLFIGNGDGDTLVFLNTVAITGVADDVGLIQGQVANGSSSDDKTPTISGTLSAAQATGATLKIFNGNTLLGSVPVNNTAKTWTFTPTLPATAGTTYSITARVADAAGNLGTASAVRTFTLDTTAPAITAAITNVADDFGETQGEIANGGSTDDRWPMLTGTLSAALATGEILQIFNGTTLLGSATVNKTAKTWTYTPTLPATKETKYFITASVADEAGNRGSASAARDFLLQTPNVATTYSSAQTKINNIWSGDLAALNPIDFSKFIGLAQDGFGVYDNKETAVTIPTTVQDTISKLLGTINNTKAESYTYSTPLPYTTSGEFKTDEYSGFGIGAGFEAKLKAGLNLSLKAILGSADLVLNDGIKWSWDKTGLDSQNQQITLSSSYFKNDSSLNVKGANLKLALAGIADIDINTYLEYKMPYSDWEKKVLPSIRNTAKLFDYSFFSNLPQYQDFQGFGNIDYHGLNLDTTSYTQLERGVQSSANSSLLDATLDVDAILALILKKSIKKPKEKPLKDGSPASGFAISGEFDTGLGLKASYDLDFLNILLKANTSISQNISANVDNITGILKLDGKEYGNYAVGDKITLPLSKYDNNNDGVISVNFDYTRLGRVSNKTDLELNTSAELDCLSGNIAGTADLYFAKYSDSTGFGPLFSSVYPITSNTINISDISWGTSFGTGSNSFDMVWA
jgi:hypothetical protein